MPCLQHLPNWLRFARLDDVPGRKSAQSLTLHRFVRVVRMCVAPVIACCLHVAWSLSSLTTIDIRRFRSPNRSPIYVTFTIFLRGLSIYPDQERHRQASACRCHPVDRLRTSAHSNPFRAGTGHPPDLGGQVSHPWGRAPRNPALRVRREGVSGDALVGPVVGRIVQELLLFALADSVENVSAGRGAKLVDG